MISKEDFPSRVVEGDRLNRIEQKIDKLSEAVIVIARVEEKLTASNARVDRLEVRADEQEGQLDTLKEVVGYNTQTAKLAERMLWLIVTSVVGVIAYGMKL